MMMRILLTLAVVVLCSCSASENNQCGGGAPQELRETSGWQFQFEGRDYWWTMNGRDVLSHGVELDGEDGLAYALYSFGGFSPIIDLDHINITMPSLEPFINDANVYIGLSDFEHNAWTWFDTELPDFQLDVLPDDNYVSASGVIHLAVVLDGDAVGEVAAIELVGDSQPEWLEDSRQAIPGVLEPSGICMAPDNLSMFIIDDGTSEEPSGVAEIDLAFHMTGRLDLGNDLEGVCYCPVDSMLYVVEESEELIYIVDPQTLTKTDSFYYSRSFGGNEVIEEGGDGVEGIAFIPDPSANGGGYFLLLNQNDPTALLRINKGDIASNPPGYPAPLSGFTPVEDRNAGALYFDAPKRRLWVIHSWADFVEVYNVDTMQLISRDNFPGFAQEGATLDQTGNLWVCDDSGFLGKYEYSEPQVL